MVARVDGAEARAAAAEAAEDESARQAALWKRRCMELSRKRAEEREAKKAAMAATASSAAHKQSQAACAEEQGQETAADRLPHSQVIGNEAMAQCTLAALAEAMQWHQERMQRIDATLAAAAAKAAARNEE